MKLTSRLFVALCLLTIYVITTDTRSVLQDNFSLLVSSSSQQDESKFRHRVEHSMDLQALRWSLRKLGKDDLCEFCDLMVPLVG